MPSMEEKFGKLIITLDGCLSADECDALVARANGKGWNRSAPSGGGHGRTGREDARTNEFCVFKVSDLGPRSFVLSLRANHSCSRACRTKSWGGDFGMWCGHI